MTVDDGVEWLCRPGLDHRGSSPRQALHLAGRYAEAADGFLRRESAWGPLAPSGGLSRGRVCHEVPISLHCTCPKKATIHTIIAVVEQVQMHIMHHLMADSPAARLARPGSRARSGTAL